MFRLNSGQEFITRAAVDWYYNSNELVFQYTGGPGTGKSVVLNEIITRIGLDPVTEVAAMSYIGSASIVMRMKGLINAKTAHSWLYDMKETILRDEFGRPIMDELYNVPIKVPKFIPNDSLPENIKLIVIDELINSMTEFKQIIGRGTRLRWDDGKTHFVIMDFRGVTRLFADPDWDGPIEQDEDFRHVEPKDPMGGDTVIMPPPPAEPKHKYVVDSRGCKVSILQKMVAVYDTDGKLLRQESIIDYTKANIYSEFSSLNNFILQWSAEEKKAKIQELFLERGIDLAQIKADEGMSDVDDYDFICHVAFDQKPLTRRERAENVKKRNVFAKYGGEARAVLEALLEKYADSGIYEIEDMDILKLDPFVKFGKPAKIAQLFGGREGYIRAVRELENEIYKAA